MTERILRVSVGWALGMVLATVVGCQNEAPDDVTLLADSVYVEALAELVHIHERVQTSRGRSDSLATWADSTRRSVLMRLGVRKEDLLAYAKERGEDPVYMKEVWESIAARVDSLDGKATGAQGGAESRPDSGVAPSRNGKGESP